MTAQHLEHNAAATAAAKQAKSGANTHSGTGMEYVSRKNHSSHNQ